MSFLLDTCAISELRRQEPNHHFLAWFTSVDPDRLYLSSLTLGELQKGISLLPEGRKKVDIVTWFDELTEAFASQTLAITPRIAVRWGKLSARLQNQGNRLPVIDGLIASTALEEELAIVTRNMDDFMPTGVTCINPWTE